MTTTHATIRVVTNAGTNASAVGEAYSGMDGVIRWRNAVDRCDFDDAGRVFIDCDDMETAALISDYLDGDDRVQSYTIKQER
jgi:hypothetical protein